MLWIQFIFICKSKTSQLELNTQSLKLEAWLSVNRSLYVNQIQSIIICTRVVYSFKDKNIQLNVHKELITWLERLSLAPVAFVIYLFQISNTFCWWKHELSSSRADCNWGRENKLSRRIRFAKMTKWNKKAPTEKLSRVSLVMFGEFSPFNEAVHWISFSFFLFTTSCKLKFMHNREALTENNLVDVGQCLLSTVNVMKSEQLLLIVQ